MFRKSRSRLEDVVFHLQAVKEFPAFLDVASKEQAESEERQPRKKERPTKPNPREMELPPPTEDDL
jgi:hypothetical protein